MCSTPFVRRPGAFSWQFAPPEISQNAKRDETRARRTLWVGAKFRNRGGRLYANVHYNYHGAHGVVVSHPLSMREALGSIPCVQFAGGQTCSDAHGWPAWHLQNKMLRVDICIVCGYVRGFAIPGGAATQRYTPNQVRTGDLQRVRLTT